MQEYSEEYIKEEAARSILPSLPLERVINLPDMIMMQASFSIATWMIIMGAYTGMATPLPLAIIASLFGLTVPLTLICFIGVSCARYGCDHPILYRVAFGTLGGTLIAGFIAMVSMIGWTSIPVVMFGRAVSESVGFLGGSAGTPWFWSIVALSLSTLILYKWTLGLKYFFRIATPTIIIILILMTYRILSIYSLSEIAAIIPEGFHENPFSSFMIAVELNVGLGFSWIICFAIYCRLAKTESAAFYGPWLGWGPLWALATIPAILAALIAGVTDPVYLLKDYGSTWVILYLIFLALANIFSAVCTMYIVSLTARTIWPKLTWGKAVAINWIVIILIFWPAIYDTYGSFVALIGAVLGPVGLVVVSDLFIRRMYINLPECFDTTKESLYYYWKGFNAYAILSAAVGTIISFAIYNPLTMEIHIPSIFHICGAAIPASIAAGLLYFVCAKLFLMPKKIGFPDFLTKARS